VFTGCLLALREASAKRVGNELVCTVPPALSQLAASQSLPMPPRLQLLQVESQRSVETDGPVSQTDVVSSQ
jgi:hypothetical protein